MCLCVCVNMYVYIYGWTIEEQFQFMKVKSRTCERCQRQRKWWQEPYRELEVANSSMYFFLRFYYMKHCVRGKVYSSLLLGTMSSLSSFSTSFAIPLLSTWTQLPRYLWYGIDWGKDREAKLQVNSGAAQNDFLFKWKPRTIRPLMCYNSFDYTHFWLSVNNVLNG